jgi:hypothetical protein
MSDPCVWVGKGREAEPLVIDEEVLCGYGAVHGRVRLRVLPAGVARVLVRQRIERADAQLRSS